MSYFTQMAGLAVHNFISAATGIAVAVALIRGLVRKQADSFGNFWADLTRARSTAAAVIDPVRGCARATGSRRRLSHAMPRRRRWKARRNSIPLGPAASQIAIKQLGTNGGGFFGQNSAHPFENPTPLTNFLEILAIFWHPVGARLHVWRHGEDRRQGWAIWAAMFALFAVGLATLWWAELQPNAVTGLTSSMEGKEVRFGLFNTALFATVDDRRLLRRGQRDARQSLAARRSRAALEHDARRGDLRRRRRGTLRHAHVRPAHCLHRGFDGRPHAGISRQEDRGARRSGGPSSPCSRPRWSSSSARASTMLYPAALNSLNNAGPHGLSEILYAFTSAAANNGSAFAGLSGNTGLV